MTVSDGLAWLFVGKKIGRANALYGVLVIDKEHDGCLVRCGWCELMEYSHGPESEKTLREHGWGTYVGLWICPVHVALLERRMNELEDGLEKNAGR